TGSAWVDLRGERCGSGPVRRVAATGAAAIRRAGPLTHPPIAQPSRCIEQCPRSSPPRDPVRSDSVASSPGAGERAMSWSRDFAMDPPMLVKVSAPGYVYVLLPFRYVRSMGGSVHAAPVLDRYALVRSGGMP